MSNAIKVNIQGQERQTLLQLVKAERRAIEEKSTQQLAQAQKRAIQFYEAHLIKVQKKLDPKATYLNKW